MKAEGQEYEIGIQGMNCQGCAQTIEHCLKSFGVSDARVHLATASAEFTLEHPELLPKILKEIEKLGFTPEHGTHHHHAHHSGSSLQFKFIFSLIFTAPLLAHMVLAHPWLHDPWIQMFLCFPVFLLGLWHFGRSALASLRSRYANMDVLIVIGIIAAFTYSFIGTVLQLGESYLFYETAATIVTFVLFGNLLEERSVRKTASAIEQLVHLQPPHAHRIIPNSTQVEEVSVDHIQKRDRLRVNSGDRVPVDGVIVDGGGAFDESMLSGESLPVEKTKGAQVIGGTVLTSGTITLSAEAIGQDTVLANMIRLVKQAQDQKPRVQRIGDRVSNIFVPSVVVVAIAVFLGTLFFADVGFQGALLRCIAVLVVACPCAMGLATPTAVMVGVGQAARNGILIRGGNTLENLAEVETIIFDKTGTLTTGAFEIQELATFEMSKEEAKSIILGIERHSSHPIANSIQAALASSQALEFERVDEQKGLGLQGKTKDGRTFLFGSARFVGEREVPSGFDLYLMHERKVVAALKIQDQIKANASEIISQLQKAKVETILLSGDREERTARVAELVGIKTHFSQKLPEEKLTIIKQYEQQSVTGYVGDGINDAPALAATRVGVSLSNASQIAIESAQVILLDGNLQHLPQAIAIARNTLRIIKQNLFWAFFYNSLGIPLAALGILSPMFGALAMACSDFVVILNSLRLKAKSVARL